MISTMRVKLAVLLARAAAGLVAGHDDRVVILNTQRRRGRYGPGRGRVAAFISTRGEPRCALVFPPDEAPRSLGLPVPAIVARLAGWDLTTGMD
jgi:hypothetical protein